MEEDEQERSLAADASNKKKPGPNKKKMLGPEVFKDPASASRKKNDGDEGGDDDDDVMDDNDNDNENDNDKQKKDKKRKMTKKDKLYWEGVYAEIYDRAVPSVARRTAEERTTRRRRW